MSELYRVYAKKRGTWRTLKSFNDPSDLMEAKSLADDLLQHNEYDKAVILEKIDDNSAQKSDFQVKYKATRAQSSLEPESEIELRVEKGISGEWIVVPERYAKRHDLFGIYGWLVWAGFSLGLGPIADLFSIINELNNLPIPVILSVIVFSCAISWGPLYLLWKKKKAFPAVAISVRVLLIPLGILAFDPITIGWSILMIFYLLLSVRVNVTYKHRVRRSDLKRVIPKRLLKSARFLKS